MNSTSVSVYILAFNESIHIERAILSALKITPDVYVIDSSSSDDTVSKAKALGAKVFQYDWTSKSNFARKLNWTLSNVPFNTTWVIRLDADEYFLDKTISELTERLSLVPSHIDAVSLNRRFIFLGKWIKRGFYPQLTLRITRNGCVKYDDTWLDEHVNVPKNKIYHLPLDIVDESLIGINKWTEKHLHYSNLQVIEEVKNSIITDNPGHFGKKKMFRYRLYNMLPIFLRPFIYFFYRYFIRLGFMDGSKGFIWAFLQAWWYRMLIDIKLLEINLACGSDIDKQKDYVKKFYNVDL
jgi:glycosyltransferase involved in cell wall biosynthesis